MKFTVNENLIQYFKSIRKDKKISVQDFSKFDNCDFKTLTLEDFNLIFLTLANNNQADATQLMDNYFLILEKEGLLKKDINLYIDFSNYSHIIKDIDIDENLIDKMNKLFESKRNSLHELVSHANKNVAVQKYSNFSQIDFNEYFTIPLSDEIISDNDQQNIYVKVKLDEEHITKIFNKEIKQTKYLYLLALANAYYQIELSKIDDESLKHDKDIIAAISAHNLLFNFKFYSLNDYKRIEENNKRMNTLNENLGTISHSMQSILVNYINLIAQIYKQNPFYIEDKLKSYDVNLRADAGFCIALLDLPIYKVKSLNTDTKKKLLNELSEVIERYASDEEYKEQIELI